MPRLRKMAQKRRNEGSGEGSAATTASSSASTSAASTSASGSASAPDDLLTGRTDVMFPRLPREPRLRKLVRHKEKLDLVCLWHACSFSTRSMQKFNTHVGKHVPVCLEPGVVYERCHWADCTFHGSEEGEMRRHVLYHAYHAKLMALGTNVSARNELQDCKLDPSERHMVPELKSFVCAWEDCTLVFDDPQSFFWHVEHHINCHYLNDNVGRMKPSRCLWEGCTAVANTYHRLIDHSRVHTREKYLGCPNCGIVFANNQKFADHIRRQAPVEELRFQCSHCLKLYSTERLLREHIRLHINSIRCEYCGMTLPSPRAMRLHVLYKHNDERSFACPKCDKRYKQAFDLNRHLAVHEAAERGERHVCPHPGCRFIFINPERLKKHFRKVHSEEPRSYYFCHLCEARYLTVSSISCHLRKFHQLDVPEGHSRFNYRRDRDGHFRLQTLRYESLEVAEQAPPPPPPPPPPGLAAPDVLALSCQEEDVPDTITTDDGRELHLPEQVRRGLSTGRRVLVCVQGDQVQLLARMDAMDELRDPDDPDALMMVVDGQAVADGPAAAAH